MSHDLLTQLSEYGTYCDERQGTVTADDITDAVIPLPMPTQPTRPRHGWLIAAAEKNLPIFTPGWEDSTLGNIYTANVMMGRLKGYSSVASGLECMESLAKWYQENCGNHKVGFFQIGGGIAGDFPICVVPLIEQDLKRDTKLWSYFCQISDSTASYGSYSGAVPNEKITWGKLDTASPKFIIESDATIVAPLVFAYVMAS